VDCDFLRDNPVIFWLRRIAVNGLYVCISHNVEIVPGRGELVVKFFELLPCTIKIIDVFLPLFRCRDGYFEFFIFTTE